MNGLICEDQLVDHSLFLSFKLAIKNHFGIENFHTVKCLGDLAEVKRLFIVDEHFSHHLSIWKNINFIKEVNLRKIQVIAFNFERIHSAQFPWNLDHQNALLLFEDLHQFVADINDAKILGKKVINKQYISSDLIFNFNNERKNRILFLGQCNQYYPNRADILNECQRLGLPLDVAISDRKLGYVDFLNALSSYKYILNPLGTGEFINLRFYETLAVGSIPIQQFTPDMKPWYAELNQSLAFNEAREIPGLIKNPTTLITKKYFLEDYFCEISLKSLV